MYSFFSKWVVLNGLDEIIWGSLFWTEKRLIYNMTGKNNLSLVYLVAGENPAAMQTGTSHRQSPSPVLWILFMLISIQKCLQRTHWTPECSTELFLVVLVVCLCTTVIVSVFLRKCLISFYMPKPINRQYLLISEPISLE